MKNVIFIILLYLFATPVYAVEKDPIITFNKKHHDFGTLSEDSNPRTYSFEFKNNRKEAVAISRVQTTCGCAVANYIRTPVQSGEFGKINITFTPQGHPGKFYRTIIVNISGSKEVFKLTITGNVTQGAKRKHKEYPYVIGDLQLKSMGLKFTPMRSIKQERIISIINSGSKKMRVSIRTTEPNIYALTNPSILHPNVKAEIIITRKADDSKLKSKCIKLQEDVTKKKTAEDVFLILTAVDCK